MNQLTHLMTHEWIWWPCDWRHTWKFKLICSDKPVYTDAQTQEYYELKNLTWNCEGFIRNKYNFLKLTIEDEEPTWLFISEPWLHLTDAALALDDFLPRYNFYLNSEDRHDNLLALVKSRAHGGTLALWRKDLDPYITIREPSSSRILCLILDKPGYKTSIHITVYLPTAGKDAEFVRDLVILQKTVDDTFDEYPDALMFIRGDANAACPPRHQNKRDELLRHFIENNRLSFIPLNHSAYHHFTNNGLSDFSINLIMSNDISTEYLNNSFCSKANSVIFS